MADSQGVFDLADGALELARKPAAALLIPSKTSSRWLGQGWDSILFGRSIRTCSFPNGKIVAATPFQVFSIAGSHQPFNPIKDIMAGAPAELGCI
jgi:hypothetical protein